MSTPCISSFVEYITCMNNNARSHTTTMTTMTTIRAIDLSDLLTMFHVKQGVVIDALTMSCNIDAHTTHEAVDIINALRYWDSTTQREISETLSDEESSIDETIELLRVLNNVRQAHITLSRYIVADALLYVSI